jgi:hypothetical protein
MSNIKQSHFVNNLHCVVASSLNEDEDYNPSCNFDSHSDTFVAGCNSIKERHNWMVVYYWEDPKRGTQFSQIMHKRSLLMGTYCRPVRWIPTNFESTINLDCFWGRVEDQREESQPTFRQRGGIVTIRWEVESMYSIYVSLPYWGSSTGFGRGSFHHKYHLP